MVPIEIAKYYEKDPNYADLIGKYEESEESGKLEFKPGKFSSLLEAFGVDCKENLLADSGSFLIANIFHYFKKHSQDPKNLNAFYQFCLNYQNDILGVDNSLSDRAVTIFKKLLVEGDVNTYAPLIQFDKGVFVNEEGQVLFDDDILHLTSETVGIPHKGQNTTLQAAKEALRAKENPAQKELTTALDGMSDNDFTDHSIKQEDINDYIKAYPILEKQFITDATGYVAARGKSFIGMKPGEQGPNQKQLLIHFPFKSFILLKRVTNFFSEFENKLEEMKKNLEILQMGEKIAQSELEDGNALSMVLDFILKTKDKHKDLLHEKLSTLHKKFATDSQKLYDLYDRIYHEIGYDFLISIFKESNISLEIIHGYLKFNENVKNFVIGEVNSITKIDTDLIKWSLYDEEAKINFIKNEKFFLYLLNKNFQSECLPLLENLHTEICEQFFNGNENSKDVFFLFLKLSPLKKNREYLHGNKKANEYIQNKIIELLDGEKLSHFLVYEESEYFDLIEWLIFDEKTGINLAASSFFYDVISKIFPSENIIEKLIRIFDKDINNFFENRSQKIASLNIAMETHFINHCSYVHIEYYKQMILTLAEKERLNFFEFYIPKFFKQKPQACAEFMLTKLNEQAFQEALSHLHTKENKEHIVAWLEALPAQYLEGVLNNFEKIQPVTSEMADQIISAFYHGKPDLILQWCIKRDFFANYVSYLYKESPKTLALFMRNNKALTDEQALAALKLFSKDDLQDAIVAWRELVDNDEESRKFLSAHKIEVNEAFLNLLETVQNTETLLADADIDELKPKSLEPVSQELIDKVNEEATSNASEKSGSKQITELVASFNQLAGTFPISLFIRPLSESEKELISNPKNGSQLTTLSDLISGQLSSFKAWFLRFSSRYREFSSVLEPTENLNTKGITEADRARVRLLSSANWIQLGADALSLLNALPLPKEELWQRIYENWSKEDFAKLGCASFTWEDLKNAFVPQVDKNLAERVNNMNQARRKIGLELKIPSCFVAPGAHLQSQSKPELLYQLQENDIQVGEEILRRVQKRDNGFEYLLMPFPNVVGNLAVPGNHFGLCLKNIMDSIPNRNPDEKPILVHGTLSVNDNHYLPFFAYKNSLGKIQVITIDPSAPHRNEKSKTVIDLENYFNRFNFEYRDAQIGQQLSERNCGFLSIDTQLVAITKPLFKLENDSLTLDASQLTVNGNINRILDKDNHTYLYTTTLESAANKLRFQWAKKFEEFNFNEAEEAKVLSYLLFDENIVTIEDLRHIQNKTIAPDQEVITILPLDKYNYKENYGAQRQNDTDAELKSEIFGLIEEAEAGLHLMKEIKKGFTETLIYPDDETLLPLLREVQKAFDAQKRRWSLPTIELNLTQLKPVIANILQEITLDTLRAQFRHFLHQFEDNSYPSCEKVVEKFLKGSNSDQLLSLFHSLTQSEQNAYLRYCTRTAEKSLLDKYLQKTLSDVAEFIKTNWLEIQKNLNPGEILEKVILNRLNSQHAGVRFLNDKRDNSIDNLIKFEFEPISEFILKQIKNLKDEHYNTQYTALKTALANCSLPDLIGRFEIDKGIIRIHDLLKDQADVMLHDETSSQAIFDIFYQTLCEKITGFLSDKLSNETLPNLMALYNQSTKLQKRLNGLLKNDQIDVRYELWSQIDANKIFSKDLISEHCKRHLNSILEFLAVSPKSNMTLEQMKKTLLGKREDLLTVAADFGWGFIFDAKNKLTEQGGYLVGLLSTQFHVYKKEQMDQKNAWKKHKAIQEKLVEIVGAGVIDLTDLILDDDTFDSKARCQEINDIIALNYKKLTTSLLTLSESSYEAYVILKSAVSNNLWEHLHTQEIGTIGTSLSIESKRFLELEPLIEAVCKTKEERERVIYNGDNLPNLTKGVVTDCLHLFRELKDKQNHPELEMILHELYKSTPGSLNGCVVNSSALKELTTLLHKFFKKELGPEAESVRTILMKLAKTKTMAILLNSNLKNWNDDKVRGIIYSNHPDSKTHPSSILEKDSWPLGRQLKEIRKFSKQTGHALGCDSLIEKIKNEKSDDQKNTLDAIDFMLLKHEIREDIERIWGLEKSRMREDSRRSTIAMGILIRHEYKLTYAALQELYIYWQVNHHAITTILRPGRWFKADHMPDGIRQIGLVLNDFNKRLKNGDITSPWVEVSEDDKLLLKVITGLRDRRTHYFGQTRSAEIFGAIRGYLTNSLPTERSIDRLGRLENKTNLELKHFRFKLMSQLGPTFFQSSVPGVTQNNKWASLPGVGRRE